MGRRNAVGHARGPARWLATLSARNPTAVFLVTAVLVVGILLVPGALGGVLLLALAAGCAVLLVGTWHRHQPRARALRLAILGGLLLLAIIRFS
jgi:hypothetical protein